MTQTPQLSLIIPVHNGESCIGELLQSLEDKLVPGVEVVCVDDASTDRTGEILASHPWVRNLHHEERRGAAAARNTGARAARSALLLFLDADTRVTDPDFFPRCMAFFRDHPEFAAFSGCYQDRNPMEHAFARFLDGYEAFLREAGLEQETRGCLSGSVCGLRREAFEAMDGFDENPAVVMEDADLGCRLGQAGLRHFFSSAIRVAHRQPGLWHYCRELVPRTRHYLHLLRHHGAFNEVMGGAREGQARAAAALSLLLLPVPPLALAALILLLGINHRLWLRLIRTEGWRFLPLGLLYYLATTVPICLGGALGLWDGLRHGLRRKWADLRVVLAYLRSLASPGSPGYLIHFLTHRCNARCGHCFDHPQRATIQKQDELSLEEIRRLAAHLGPVGHVSLTGGEPFLRDDLPEIVGAYHEAGVRSLSLSTNGSLPERLADMLPRMLRAAPGTRLMVTLSIDGLGHEHDTLRGLPGLFGQVETSLRFLQRLKPWWPQLRLHACVTASSANEASFAQTLSWLQEKGFDQVELNQMRGTPEAATLRPVSWQQYDRARSRMRPLPLARWSLSTLFAALDRAMFGIVRRHGEPWPCGTCLAGRRLAVILAQGEVLPCEMLRNVKPDLAEEYGQFVMGRLREQDYDLGTLLAGKPARRITAMIESTQCRCSFECAIFATLAYRPWTLPAVLWKEAENFSRSAGTRSARTASHDEPQEHDQRTREKQPLGLH